MALSERSKIILKSLIDLYIAEGEPVGSKKIAEATGLALSPATIRHIMAELESLGLIASPHASAGRIPTNLGYRLFVDSLVTIKPVDQKAQVKWQQQLLQQPHDANQLIQHTSHLLSSITQMAGLVSAPKYNELVFRQVEFIKLSAQSVLLILVTKHGEIQNRILQTDRAFSDGELTQASNYINQHFSGLALNAVRQQLLQVLQQDRHHIDVALQQIIEAAKDSFAEKDREGPVFALAGQGHLLNRVDDDSVIFLKKLFDAFTQKQMVLQLFDHCLKAQGVRIYIGEESGFSPYSVVTAPYRTQQNALGIVGVIGPTRMAYDQVISVVETTAHMLSSIAGQGVEG